jgi:hypothetical protein
LRIAARTLLVAAVLVFLLGALLWFGGAINFRITSHTGDDPTLALSNALLGLGFMVMGCFVAILARIAQASTR